MKRSKFLIILILAIFTVTVGITYYYFNFRYNKIISFTEKFLKTENLDSLLVAESTITSLYSHQVLHRKNAEEYFGNSLDCFHSCFTAIANYDGLISKNVIKVVDPISGQTRLRIKYKCCELNNIIVFEFVKSEGLFVMSNIYYELS